MIPGGLASTQGYHHQQSPLSEFDSDYGSLSIESQQQLSGPASVGKLSIQQSPSILSSSSFINAAPMQRSMSEEHQFLNQLWAENDTYAKKFGFVLDKNGTIIHMIGDVEQFFGLNAIQMENQKLMSFVSNNQRQKICGLLPSAFSANATRKQTEIEFNSDKTKQTFTLQVVSQAYYVNLNESTGKKPCVVCVARQTVVESTFFISLDFKTRRILRIEFNDNKLNLNANDFVGKSIEMLCDQNDRGVLDALLNSLTPCSGKIIFTIQNKSILTDVVKNNNGDEIGLECSYNHESVDSYSQLAIDKKPLELSVSDKNFNYQNPQQLFSPNGYHQFQNIDPNFQCPSFQATQQPQLQPTNMFVNNFQPKIEQASPSQTIKKQRKPRKPRNSSNPTTKTPKSQSKTAQNEQPAAAISHPKSEWPSGNSIEQYWGNPEPVLNFSTQNHIHLTGQPYPAPMNNLTMPYNQFPSYNPIDESSLNQLSSVNNDSEVKPPKRRQRNTNKQRNNNSRNTASKQQTEPESQFIGMYQQQTAGSVSNSTTTDHFFPSTSSTVSNQLSCGPTYSNQQQLFEASRSGNSTAMSTMQVANNNYPIQPHQMNPMSQPQMPGMYNNSSMNQMPMNGMSYQMNSAQQPQAAAWNQQNGQMMSNTPNDFHPMYHQHNQQAQMQQMMYNQQQQQQQANLNSSALNTSQTQKAGAKRKNTQQGMDANLTTRPSKQAAPFMQPNNGMMPGQHFQQFPPQSNPMYNPATMMGQPANMQQHVAQMNQQQQMLAQQQQMMTNGSPQFSAPATPSNNHVSPYQANNMHNQKPSSEAVRIELRHTLQTRQNANSPSSQQSTNSQPQTTPMNQMPHSAQSNPMTNEMNGMRFPPSNDSMPNLLSSPRMSNNQQPMVYNGMQQQNTFPAQNQARSNINGAMQQEKTEIRNDFLLADFDLDQKSMFHHTGDDSLHIDTQLTDFCLFSGRFDLDDKETQLLVEKLLG